MRSELVGRRELVMRARVRGRELFIRAGVEGLVVRAGAEGLVVRAGVEGCSSSFSSSLAEAEELVVRVGAGISCKHIC
jgi:hypothetical protein